MGRRRNIAEMHGVMKESQIPHPVPPTNAGPGWGTLFIPSNN